jgi:predicted nucleic-acid-binding protein
MRILLDTSFLLPSLGVEVTGAAEAPENLEGNDFYYSKFSILECSWIFISLERKEVAIDMEIVEIGLYSIERSYRCVIENAEVFIEALKLRRAGHTDFLDCLLYAISLKEGLKFLSFDAELKKIVRKKGFEDLFLTI